MEVERMASLDELKKISLISILSFVFCFIAIGAMIFNSYANYIGLFKEQNIKYMFGSLPIIFAFSSLVLGIIDVCLKNRKKVLSIIALVISGGISLLIILVFLILFLYTVS